MSPPVREGAPGTAHRVPPTDDVPVAVGGDGHDLLGDDEASDPTVTAVATGSHRHRYVYASDSASEAAASAACAFSARSTPDRDSEISRRSAAFGSAEASHSSVLARVSAETWTAG